MKQLIPLLIFGLLLMRLCYLEAETIKRFEFTSTLRGVEQSHGDNFKGYLFGSHQQFVIGSDDPSIKGHMDKMVGEKVRILVYTIN